MNFSSPFAPPVAARRRHAGRIHNHSGAAHENAPANGHDIRQVDGAAADEQIGIDPPLGVEVHRIVAPLPRRDANVALEMTGAAVWLTISSRTDCRYGMTKRQVSVPSAATVKGRLENGLIPGAGGEEIAQRRFYLRALRPVEGDSQQAAAKGLVQMVGGDFQAQFRHGARAFLVGIPGPSAIRARFSPPAARRG